MIHVLLVVVRIPTVARIPTLAAIVLSLSLSTLARAAIERALKLPVVSVGTSYRYT